MGDWKRDDGGQAFPHAYGSNGMSLRDWMAGMIAGGDAAAEQGWGDKPEVTDSLIDRRARLYYRIADAMLRARAAK